MPDDLILGEQLQVRFHWKEDRFAHTIGVRLDAEVVTLLASREGTSEQWWPVSSPLQQLHVAEVGPGRRAALLLGMAGRSHWSLSVVTDRALPELIFDFACRANRRPEQLGSRYRNSGDVEMQSADRLCLRPHGSQSGVVITTQECGCAMRLTTENDDLVIACCAEPASLPQTFRWKYRVALANACAAD